MQVREEKKKKSLNESCFILLSLLENIARHSYFLHHFKLLPHIQSGHVCVLAKYVKVPEWSLSGETWK